MPLLAEQGSDPLPFAEGRTPERLAFVLHDVFAVPFDELAPIVGRSPESARQLASRARRRIRGERAVPDADLDTQREVGVRALLVSDQDKALDFYTNVIGLEKRGDYPTPA